LTRHRSANPPQVQLVHHVPRLGAASIPPAEGPMGENLMQIGEVAERVGLSLRTVRHYEEVGLVIPVSRTHGNFRLYDSDAVARLLVIKQMKPLDFTLEEMRELLTLRARLRDSRLGSDERAALRERLEMYALAARRRCVALREQLNVAEAFSRTLAEEIPLTRSQEPDRIQQPRGLRELSGRTGLRRGRRAR
jgi:MerR family transcriptional regulator, copper efflux regulator